MLVVNKNHNKYVCHNHTKNTKIYDCNKKKQDINGHITNNNNSNIIIIIIAIIINNIIGSSPGIHPPSRTDIFSRSSRGLQTMRSARTWDSGVQVGKRRYSTAVVDDVQDFDKCKSSAELNPKPSPFNPKSRT